MLLLYKTTASIRDKRVNLIAQKCKKDIQNFNYSF